MSFADDVQRRLAEVAAEGAQAAADKDSPPFFGLRPRFTAIRADLVADGRRWFVDVVNELVRHPKVFWQEAPARRLDDVTYEAVDGSDWHALYFKAHSNLDSMREKKEKRIRLRGIKKALRSGELSLLGQCEIFTGDGYSFHVLANGLVESTADISREEDIRASVLELIAITTPGG